jgi:hypothetical protein
LFEHHKSQAPDSAAWALSTVNANSFDYPIKGGLVPDRAPLS